jgi:GNAT superfamily N-acetyltransferase
VSQPARKPRLPPRHLALVTHEPVAGKANSLTAQQERFSAIAKELPPLFERHWLELGSSRDTIPLDPDWDRYFALDMAGSLIVTTARADDVLVGYIFNLVGPHLHYRSTAHADLEMFWLDPSHRGMWFSLQWFRGNDDLLREIGVKRVNAAVKNGYKDGRVGMIFKRLGYLPAETVYVKVL